MLIKARELILFKGVSVGRGDKKEELTHLFFKNDVLIFCETDKKVLLNPRSVLMGFQAVSGLSINLAKSEMFHLGIKVIRWSWQRS